jgi:proteasome lid subunit RPN8/RPN11
VLALTVPQMKAVVDQAEAAWPEEACGLLVGRVLPGPSWRVTRVEASRNLADNRKRRFEVDPGLRIGLERELRGGEEAIVGLYHSHPDMPARPSATDRTQVYEPRLVWLIVSVQGGQAIQTAAFHPTAEGFRPVDLVCVA